MLFITYDFQVASAGVKEFTDPLSKGFEDAFSPISDALEPLGEAVQPIKDAANLGLGGLNFQDEVDNVNLQEDVDRLSEVTLMFLILRDFLFYFNIFYLGRWKLGL